MKYSPHKYQSHAIDYIETHPVAAVFLDMGLGKTSITLTAIKNLLFDSFEVHKVLVIAPLRVARYTWTAEADKWDHLRSLICSVVVGTEKERMTALSTPADVYIVNRENVKWLIEDSNVPFDFDMVVIDELSSFKSHTSKRFKALLKIRPKIKRIVGLTGTPAPNGLMDLWAQFRLLDMGERLGRFLTQYRTAYFKPNQRNGQIVYSYTPLNCAEEAIYNRISDITMSMKATEHLQMPELVSSEYVVTLDEKEKEDYENLKSELVLTLDDGEITVASAAALSGKLSQMANGAVYDDDGCITSFHEKKLDALEDIIEAANGKPLLIAYWFKHDYQRIKERLNKCKIPFTRLESSDNLQKWNKGETAVALIHPASAGHGLNLQEGGSTLVWFGLTWSLELYQQTVARLWRQGQKSETVVVQHIITGNTIDEKIMKALLHKEKTQTALIDAVKADLKI